MKTSQAYCHDPLNPIEKGLAENYKKNILSDCDDAHEKYKTIVIDPPWRYGKWGKASKPNYEGHKPKESDLPYDWMTVEQIKELPINNLAYDNCEVYIWTTQKYLPDTFSVLKAWGLKYCQTLTWCKKPMGTGQGGVYCPTTEFLILARKGKMPKVIRVDSTWWEVSRAWKAHSKKPDFFQDLIETVSEEPRLEMFARREREGWDVFGDEVENSISISHYGNQASKTPATQTNNVEV
jgi:N6-adenosine-specific RNA methylase IME4